jgi:hypothetical protein
MPRPRFRYYPGPPLATVVAILFGALAAFGFMTFRATLSPEFYRSMAYLSAIMFALAIGSTIWWLGMGVTFSPRERGIVITRRGREFAFRFTDIDALTVADTPRYDNYRRVAALNRTITIEGNGQTVKAHYIALPQDALDDLLMRLSVGLANERRPRSGKGWDIDESTLRWRGEPIPLGSIVRSGLFDNEVRAWRQGESTHFLAVPYSSRNARVLLHRLHTTQPSLQSSEQVAAPIVAPVTAQDGLGRLLFTRRTTFTSVIFKSAGIGLVLWGGWLAVDRFLAEYKRLGHGAVIGLAVLAVFHALYRATMRYKFHERGLMRSTILGNRTMAYADVERVRWREKVTTISHGIAVGTTLKFRLAGGEGTKPLLMHTHQFRAGDPDLQPVLNAISASIGRNLRKQLEREGRVEWTKDATFLREGLEVRTGFLGNKPELLPYDTPLGIHFTEGYLNIYRTMWRKPLVLLDSGSENFYPGLSLFYVLMRNLQRPQEEHTA